MKNPLFLFLFPFLLLYQNRSFSQSLSVGTPVLEENLRIRQLTGELNTKVSFMVWPLANLSTLAGDSLSQTMQLLLHNMGLDTADNNRKKGIWLLPAIFKQQLNSQFSYGWNDGSMIPAKGYQSQLSAGFYANWGPLSIQVRPELVFAQNAAFDPFLLRRNDSNWQLYYDTGLNVIDAPFRFGERPYTKLFPGQSSIRLTLKKLSFGFSTENLWWGPGVRNSLLMTNNAPGFPHLTLNTTSPVQTPIGSFEGQMIGGFLKKSGILPPDTNQVVNGRRLYLPKPDGDRYINGLVVTWQPKWTNGFYLGFSRVFYSYRDVMSSSIKDYLPVIGGFFKGSGDAIGQQDQQQRDQMISIFFRLLQPKEKLELYGELGRNDHSGNLRDFVLEPEHSAAYTIGLKKLFETPGKWTRELMAEITHLQMSNTRLVREQQSWYSHYQVRDGYTHRGQIIGAGIGSGSSSQTIGLSWFKGLNKTGFLLERIVRNNDYFYHTFPLQGGGGYWKHWVDLSATLHKSWQHKNFLFDARLCWVNALNYQWQQDKDVQNLHLGFSVSYLF